MKAKVKATGEIIDAYRRFQTETKEVIDFVEFDGPDVKAHYQPNELEIIEDDVTVERPSTEHDDTVEDKWATRRYEISKACLAGILANQSIDMREVDLAEYAVRCADALIAELKKQEQ